MLALMLKLAPFHIVLVHILIVAAGTELVQFFIDGRSPLFADFFIHTAGSVSGFFLISLIRL